jgi:hypothetical protein
MKIVQPGGHLDQMLRQTRNHHVQLSAMADAKAGTLITVSSVLITLSAPHVLDQALKWPVIILAVGCFSTIVLAIYAVMPKLGRDRKLNAPPDLQSSKFNLLFFGNFTRLDYSQFEKAMEEMMNDPSRTYEMQVREIYTLGQYLAIRKYRTLRWAYIAFILGFFFGAATLLLSLRHN